MAGEGTIRIYRGQATPPWDLLLNYKVEIDGKTVGQLPTMQSRGYSVSSGEHKVFVIYAVFRSSKRFDVEIVGGQEVKLYCRTGWYGDPVLRLATPKDLSESATTE